MQRGLEGRRIALYARDESATLRRALEAAGAKVELLSGDEGRPEEDWHGGKYAALVVGACVDEGKVEPKVLQLFREFLVSDKPIVAFGEGLSALEQAGGSREDAVIATEDPGDLEAFTGQLVGQLANRLDEGQIDEMSEQSFPASDPPSLTPTSAGPAPPIRDGEARG